MKPWIVSVAIAGICIFHAGLVVAQGKGGSTDERRQKALERFDLDGDGVLSAEEREKAREAMAKLRDRSNSPDSKRSNPGRPQVDRRQLMEKFDKNGDGRLDDQERSDARRAMEDQRKPAGQQNLAGMKRLMQRVDKDGDGRLSEQERDELRKLVTAQIGEDRNGMAAQRLRQIMQRIGQLGGLSDEQRAAMRKRTLEKSDRRARPQRPIREEAAAPRRKPRISPELLKEFDKDGDGELNAEERKAARKKRDATDS